MTVEKVKKIWLADGIHLVRDLGDAGEYPAPWVSYFIQFTGDDLLGTVKLRPNSDAGVKAMREVCNRLFVRAEMEARERAKQRPLFGEDSED